MTPLDPARFTACCQVRPLRAEDIPAAVALYRSNPLFCQGREITAANVERDRTLLPPYTDRAQKYFVGYFQQNALTAVLDLIAGYPDDKTGFIGLFMVHGDRSGQGLGSRLIEDLSICCREAGLSALRLAYDPDNPQAAHFWSRQGFLPLYESRNAAYGRLMVAQREI